ncbi:family 43 glycosylhydrolase [Acidipila rosea]|uniref:Arabinan endo-1,5-alpha-L-arabinosidase n=1 Tax=Acidipila rosea TaxID=768535 RepID=A0A4R1LAR2_9BACT|nr:family 43 glycosylhydrolase [Acidipila rosea]TCK75254.1 arabinan endo-1,5-alpha-L-arabinosidase [Acidipila rosea]
MILLRNLPKISAVFLLVTGSALAQSTATSGPPPNYNWPKTYTNPLQLNTASGPAVSCPDPAIIRQRIEQNDTWYLYCTGDPLNSADMNANGQLNAHLITQFKSYDLIHWTYIGDAFQHTPAWVGNATNQFWAAAVKHFNGKYYLYYVAPNTLQGGAAIGVATSQSPAGPWTDAGAPVVAPENNPYNGAPGRAVIDPDVVKDDTGQRYITYGSFNGGISIRKLSASGLTSDPATEKQIAVDNYYEGGNFFKHDGYYYFFASVTGCCDGPLSGYSVRVGRARSPMGPFLDQNGVDMNSFDPGGNIAIAANGNRWVGPGGNVIFQDDSGQAYMLYHAIDANAPYFDGYAGYTRRPALIDPIDWVDGWPTVRSGRWASVQPQPAPAAQPWQYNTYQQQLPPLEYAPGKKIAALSDEFNSAKLSPQWHFIHPNANNSYSLTGSAYEASTQGFDENSDPTQVSILAEPVPLTGDWMVETKVTTSVPFNNQCCYNFAQGALFIYLNDQNSIKLDVFPDFDTRQTEFGKQVGPVPAHYPTYDHQAVGNPGATTWLRIVRRTIGDRGELYTAYSSTDGETWTKGGTWQHQLGSSAQIGISALNAAGFTMDFDYVRVYRLRPER